MPLGHFIEYMKVTSRSLLWTDYERELEIRFNSFLINRYGTGTSVVPVRAQQDSDITALTLSSKREPKTRGKQNRKAKVIKKKSVEGNTELPKQPAYVIVQPGQQLPHIPVKIPAIEFKYTRLGEWMQTGSRTTNNSNMRFHIITPSDMSYKK
jgi:hypothetical protein